MLFTNLERYSDTLFVSQVVSQLNDPADAWKEDLTNDYCELMNVRITELNRLDSADIRTLKHLIFFQREKEAIKQFVKNERCLLIQSDGQKFIGADDTSPENLQKLEYLNQAWVELIDNFERAAEKLPSGK